MNDYDSQTLKSAIMLTDVSDSGVLACEYPVFCQIFGVLYM